MSASITAIEASSDHEVLDQAKHEAWVHQCFEIVIAIMVPLALIWALWHIPQDKPPSFPEPPAAQVSDQPALRRLESQALYHCGFTINVWACAAKEVAAQSDEPVVRRFYLQLAYTSRAETRVLEQDK